ncbi:aminotransferase class I/II-fold pyridoxal phosphate-dependent enzyme [Pseudovibrio sp. SPO723]|uniref:aminotransferase class I/II-fold pyridoxal phosphate-dependent enzyme n=1 Tax=Nesiotobacter zosterae TaxID=392721 RepID=UPI0029C53E8B|nr:aminotransferase class I/II-fold pyridoxal phosphate-dependent enzyme [Pseudovibrio sp. SPO723]MDX5595021.1 aminotransferase class I/II-fold pyridoxal phosphate-dependent enzyme [Pseudovibrio sp. SPO723]
MSNNQKKPISGGNPFQRLRDQLEGIEPALEPITMTIGEPKHEPPSLFMDVLVENKAGFRKYPPIHGTPEFRAAIGSWLKARYGLDAAFDADKSVIPLNGSREGLVFACVSARDYLKKDVETPAVLLPNPFYQSYGAGAHMAGAEEILLPEQGTGILPDLDVLDPALLDRTIAFYFASPANPQGTVAPMTYWKQLIGLARKHNFLIFADECYSEIYRETPPTGVLEAASAMDGTLSHVVSFNSLSKRSNLPGLRCGFAAGDPEFIQFFANFRNIAAPQVPLPAQALAVRAYADEDHVVENRRLYNEKYAAAEEILSPLFGSVMNDGGFFLWLDVSRWGGGVATAEKLWREAGVKVLPGAYIASDMPEGFNPGADYIRLALVDSLDTSREAFNRIVTCLE